LGEDRSSDFSTEKVMEMEIDYDLAVRQAYQAEVERERETQFAAKAAELETLATQTSAIKILVAIATKGGGRVNEHFGHAHEFQIYEASTSGAKFVGHRRVDLYCEGGYASADGVDPILRALNDCAAVLVAKIGMCPKDSLEGAGIEAVETYAFEPIEQSVIAYFKDYLERVQSGAISHSARGDADIRQGAFV
jgi:nitrogen fixation protein NifB